MFNQTEHYYDDFRPLDELSLADHALYAARTQKYRPHFPWGPCLDKLFQLCFVHADRNVPGKVSYFATIDAFRADKLTRTSPEMFLERWLASARGVIRETWASEVLGKLLPTVEFYDNKDADKWYDVYENGPHSCMAGSDDVRKYAHPENDLAIAFVRNGEFRYYARSIVNQKTKTYVRVYAKMEHSDTFAAALAKLGYKRDSDASLNGQVIYVGKAECRSCDTEILTGPYLDGSHRNVELRADGKSGVIDDNGEPLRSDNDGDGYACTDCA